MRALRNKKNGYYRHALNARVAGKPRKTEVTICVASRSYLHKKTCKQQELTYAVGKIRQTPKAVRGFYRTRFGIETSCRLMNQARIRTGTRDPSLRLLLIGIALVSRNVWVWLHFKLAKGRGNSRPSLFLELLRSRQMLLWIGQVVECMLGADQVQGIDRDLPTTYGPCVKHG